MKKMISAVLAGVMMLGLCACDKKEVSETTQSVTETTTAASEETTVESVDSSESSQSSDAVAVDLTGMSAGDIAENILKASKIKAGETVDSYAERFSIVPELSCDGDLYTLAWPEDKLTLFSVRQVQIKTDADKKIDEKSNVNIVVWIDDAELSTGVSDYIRDHGVSDAGSTYNTLEVDGIYQYTLDTPVVTE